MRDVSNQINTLARAPMENQLWDQVWMHLSDTIRNAVWKGLWNPLENQMWAQLQREVVDKHNKIVR